MPLTAELMLLMQNQALPACQKVLGISLGIGSALGGLAPAVEAGESTPAPLDTLDIQPDMQRQQAISLSPADPQPTESTAAPLLLDLSSARPPQFSPQRSSGISSGTSSEVVQPKFPSAATPAQTTTRPSKNGVPIRHHLHPLSTNYRSLDWAGHPQTQASDWILESYDAQPSAAPRVAENVQARLLLSADNPSARFTSSASTPASADRIDDAQQTVEAFSEALVDISLSSAEDGTLDEALDKAPSEVPDADLPTHLMVQSLEDENIGPSDSDESDDDAEASEEQNTDSDLRLEALLDRLRQSDEAPPGNLLGDELLDDELGTIRIEEVRSFQQEELGILRLLRTAEAIQPPPPPPIAFLGGRLGFLSTDNAFRSDFQVDDAVYQTGLSFYLYPALSDTTNLYAIASTDIARYDEFSQVNYNELELQLGIRQRLWPQAFAQIGWRNQRIYSPGYREKLLSIHYLDALINHRTIFNQRTWLDSYYQLRLGFADAQSASRFRQTFTLSLNYGVTRNLRTSLLYQLDFDDYTHIARHDTYQQILGVINYTLTPESRLSLFAGTRFGRSSVDNVSLEDTYYGAGLNVNVPLF